MRAAAALAVLVAGLVACAHDPASTRLLVGRTETADGGAIELHRFKPDTPDPARVLVLPELGFAPALYAPLCHRLRLAGFDVALVVGRHLVETDSDAGWAGWLSDVARASRVHGPAPRVLAIGIGGAAAWPLALAGGASAVVAVNVPFSPLSGTARAREAFEAAAMDPARWFARRPDLAALLLTGSPVDDAPARRLARFTRPVPPRLAVEAARVARTPAVSPLPVVPLALVTGPSDALVPSEESMAVLAAKDVRYARRLGKIEAFHRHYGHLDWLATDDALDDVTSTLVAALEAVR